LPKSPAEPKFAKVRNSGICDDSASGGRSKFGLKSGLFEVEKKWPTRFFAYSLGTPKTAQYIGLKRRPLPQTPKNSPFFEGLSFLGLQGVKKMRPKMGLLGRGKRPNSEKNALSWPLDRPMYRKNRAVSGRV
jgi:hypothetical protein